VIVVDGESVDFRHQVRDGDRMSVHPASGVLDVSPVERRIHLTRDRGLFTRAKVARAILYGRATVVAGSPRSCDGSACSGQSPPSADALSATGCSNR
jgi:hypothetical protein